MPDFDALRVLLDDQQRWPAALTQNEDPQGRTFHRMLDRGMTALVRALDAEGHYYPWAQSYYSASLLLKGIFLRDESDPALAADLAALGQVVSSHAYYLDPRLAVGAFEPAQLAVNPPFEIALVHYWLGFAKFKDGTARKEKNQDPTAIVERAKEDCQRAWASAWIGMQWLFKFHFHAGLQGLAGCRLLQMIADLYCKLLNLVPDTTPPRPARLIEAAKLGGDALSFGISKTPFTSEEEIVDFIRGAVARFCGSSLPPLLIDDVQPNSNVRVGLFAADEFLKGFHRDVGGFATTSKKDALVEELRGWSDRIGKKLRPTPVSSAGGNANQSLAEYEDRSREGFLSIVSFGHFPARSIFNLTNT